MYLQAVREPPQTPVMSSRRALTDLRSPTLSYTQRLEQRIAQLEATLARSRPSVVSCNSIGERRATDITSQSGPSRIVEDLRVEEDGRLSFHGPTSLFQLPGSIRQQAIDLIQVDQHIADSKESLVNNAWRERAFEKLADIPVRYTHI